MGVFRFSLIHCLACNIAILPDPYVVQRLIQLQHCNSVRPITHSSPSKLGFYEPGEKTATRLFKYWRWGMGSSTEVLVRSIKKKANPIGEALERVTYNFFQSTENQVDYLKQESIKNFEAAFKAYLPDLPIWEVCSLCSQLCYP
ncbi:unnamed protein product [Ilex paraguariensis]|uniref:Uncharacterized protein n=1 Tax=Ilex paraguariensis TaxID=185542 RepID=A0ABC8UZR3_9AQUA